MTTYISSEPHDNTRSVDAFTGDYDENKMHESCSKSLKTSLNYVNSKYIVITSFYT